MLPHLGAGMVEPVPDICVVAEWPSGGTREGREHITNDSPLVIIQIPMI